jgi:hypothetical protein
VARGCDYSWDHPDLDCLIRDHGLGFIVRYGSRDPSKNLTRAELDAALSRGLKVCVVWQEGKTQMTRGYGGGQADALDADAFVNSLGLYGIPVYFACDQDFEAASPDAKTAIDAYCDGARSIVGKARMGGYGDDTFCTRQLGAGRITYGWQTYAWSEGTWEARCQLRQVQNDVAVCGGTIDWDESRADDYGQWPRPAAAGAAGVLVSPSVAFHGGKPYYAYIAPDGRVCCNGGVVDPGSSARSGVGLAIDPATGKKVITYTNTAGKLCAYEQQPGSTTWGWVNKGWDAK